MDTHTHNMNAHQSLRRLKEGNPAFFEKLDDYSNQYRLPTNKDRNCDMSFYGTVFFAIPLPNFCCWLCYNHQDNNI